MRNDDDYYRKFITTQNVEYRDKIDSMTETIHELRIQVKESENDIEDIESKNTSLKGMLSNLNVQNECFKAIDNIQEINRTIEHKYVVKMDYVLCSFLGFHCMLIFFQWLCWYYSYRHLTNIAIIAINFHPIISFTYAIHFNDVIKQIYSKHKKNNEIAKKRDEIKKCDFGISLIDQI